LNVKLTNLILAASAFFTAVTSALGDFISGADFSHLAYFESIGVVYNDGGQAQDGLAILKNHGLTCVRLRLFTSSAAQAQADPYNCINNLDYTVPLAVRVKNAGLQFMLDFHYSDTWADPGKQTMPAAWSSLTFTQLVQQMRDYNSNCIAAFNSAGAMPDYVQVGNEITQGLLWPYGKVPGTNATVQWSQLAQLINAAIQGIQDAAAANMPKIVIHIDRGGDWNGTKYFFDNLISNQHVQFDIIGESYYPFWHGPLTNLNTCLNNAVKRYNKPVIVAETDFPWQNSTNLYGIPATTNGQVQFVVQLAQILGGIPGRMGMGVFWWGTEYQPVSGANQAGFGDKSFFDGGGNVLPVADAFGQWVAPLLLGASLTGNSLVVTWPLSGAGMSLKSSPDLTAPIVWSTATNAVQSTGTVFNTTLTIDSDSRFYRLQSN
jgi:arabinogalactan endo-1,4-beta-galactosidase